MIRRQALTVFAIFVSLTVAGCEKEEPVRFVEADRAEQRIVFYAPSFGDSDPRVMVRTTRQSEEEYVEWRGGGATAQFWHGSTYPGVYWRRTQEHQTEKGLRKWSAMKSASFELKRAGTVPSKLGGVSYWRFRPEGLRECFAINHFWTPSMGDQGGYRDWINGYFCKPYGVALTDTDIADMLLRLDVLKGGENPAGSRRD